MAGVLERLTTSGPGRFFAKWTADHAGDAAILIAWQALLSVFPLILGMLSVLGFVLRDPEMRATIITGIAGSFPSQLGDLLGFLEQTRDLGGILGIVSLIGLLWSGSTLFGAMELVFDRFYDVPPRDFIHQRLMAFVMVAIYAALIPISVLASGVSTFLVGVSEQVLPFRVPGSALAIGWIVSFASAGVMFLALYRIVPNRSLAVRDVWRGSLLATVLFVALSQVFPIYLGYMGGGFAVYKTLGVFFLMMTWFYFIANVIVLGAELNAFSSGGGSATRPSGTAGSGERSRPAEPTGQPGSRPRVARPEATGRSAGQWNGRHDARPAWKTVAWAGLTATVAGVTLAAARKTAGGVWRALTREAPPR